MEEPAFTGLLVEIDFRRCARLLALALLLGGLVRLGRPSPAT
jgi:hypothetical protein